MSYVVREYATFSVKDARHVFRGQKRLHRKWGALYAEDDDGRRWTLLGDYGFCQLLRAQGKPMKMSDDRHVGPYEDVVPPTGLGVEGPVLDEFPVDEFRPVWRIAGWPDDWPGIGAVHVLPFVEAGR